MNTEQLRMSPFRNSLFNAMVRTVPLLRPCIVALLLLFVAGSAMAQVTVSLPDTVVIPGASLTLPLKVTGFYHIGSFSFKIGFDKNVLTYVGVANQPGGVFNSTAPATANQNGSIVISWFNIPALNIGSGTLLNLQFTYGNCMSALTFTGITPSDVTDSLGNNIANVTYTNGKVKSPGPDTPTLLSPADSAKNQPTSLTLSWNTVSGASTYRIQVSTASDFSSKIVDDSTLTSTTKAIGPLSTGMTYYWRVSAKNASGSSCFSYARSFTTIASVPNPPVLSSPANGATNQSLTPTLSWTASSGATNYRVQVSTVSNFATTLLDDSTVTATSRQVSGLSNNTTYYWRVSAKNIVGSSAFTSAWSFTTVPSPPATPTLALPANGATGVATSPTLSWNSVSGATNYRVQVATDAGFSTIVLDNASVTSTSLAVGPLSGSATYYWRVRASNAGGSSAFTAGWSFTTLAAPPLPPTGPSPANGALGQNTSLTLSWSASPGATSYRLQLSTSSSFATTIVDDSSLTVPSRAVSSLVLNTTYYWRVSAKNASGSSAFSSTWNFLTGNPPGPPTPTNPTNGAAGLSIPVVVSWTASSGATNYRLQVSLVSNFSSTVVDDSSFTANFTSVSALATNTLYYWRVSAKSSAGSSAFSSAWSFTTIAPPATPTLLLPADAATAIPVSTTLSWNPSSGATSYRLQLSISSTFLTTVVDDSTLTTTSRSVGPLLNSTTYYWHVSAANAGGSSAFSAARQFTTVSAGPPPPGIPNLVFPPDSMADAAVSTNLAWSTVGGATRYHLQVATDTSFTGLVVDDTTITGISKLVGPLASSTKYFWRVSAMNATGSGAYSVRRMFTTIAGPPSAPALTAPADGATGVDVNPTLSWVASANATYYRLQVSTSSLFTSTVVDDSTITGTSRLVGPLLNGTKYYWRVYAGNTMGAGGFSAIRNFTTVVAGLGSPTLSSPADGSTGVATNPTFTWNTLTAATFYRLQASLTSDFASLVLDKDSLTSVTYDAVGLAYATTYYWRVRAASLAGVGPYSSAWSFTTIPGTSGPLAASLPDMLAVPSSSITVPVTVTSFFHIGSLSLKVAFDKTVLTYTGVANQPAFGIFNSTAPATANADGSVVLSWFNVSPALNIASGTLLNLLFTYNGGTSSLNFTNITSSSVTDSVGSNLTCAYTNGRVRDAASVPPSAPTLASPANDAKDQPTTVMLNWSSSIGATSYRLQVSTDQNFGTTYFDQSNLAVTSKSVSGLSNGTTYFWRVSAANAAGSSAYSATRKFTTVVAAPGAPTLASPADGSSGIPIPAALTWNAVTGAVTYHLQISLASDFGTKVLDKDSLSSATYSASGLTAGTKYYWHVSAANAGGVGPFSLVWSFTTLVAPPTPPTLLLPVDSAINVYLKPTLSWNPSAGATSYELQVSPFTSFMTYVFDDTTTGTSRVIDSLNLASTYYWRVRAKNAGGFSAFSSTRTFKTILTSAVERLEGLIPGVYALRQNYPNPFNPSTTIQYDIPTSGFVSLKVYNVLGEQMLELVGAHQQPGRYVVRFNAGSLSSGMYLYQLRAGAYVQTNRMVLMK